MNIQQAMQKLRTVFPKPWNISIECTIRSYEFSDKISHDFYVSVWMETATHIQSGGKPTIAAAVSAVLNDPCAIESKELLVPFQVSDFCSEAEKGVSL